MKPYKAVIFDLFNTLALWDASRMPRFTWAGETRPSTLGELRPLLETELPQVDFAHFKQGLDETNAELAAERAASLREIPSLERFRRALLRAGAQDSSATIALAELMSRAHMNVLANASRIPSAHIDLLDRMRRKHKLALISNFDHAPTAHSLLERDGAADRFVHTVISDEHGWRKPHRRIFDDALDALGVKAGEALYVGDSVDDDVVGATQAGLDVAWVNARSDALPAGAPRPHYEVRAITELENYLL